MATVAAHGSGTPATTGTTWATATNAVDGAAGTNPNTNATYTNAVASAVGTIEITGYGFSSSIGSADTLNSVTVNLRHFENNTGRFASVKFQAFDGATAIGSQFTCTLATAARNDSTTVSATLAQLRSSTFKIVVTITGAASTQSRVESIDYVDVTADYTPLPPAVTQAAYRFYDDTGTESGAGALAAENTPVTGTITGGADGHGTIRLRLQSTDTAAVPSTDDWQLQYDKNASGTWSGLTPLVDQWASSNTADQVGVSTLGLGQSFTGTGANLGQAAFWMQVTGSPNPVEARLYAHTGVFGGGGNPTGSPLATSTSRIATSFTGTAQWELFDFDGTFTLVNGTNYCIVVFVPTAALSGNYYRVSSSSSGGTHPGNYVIYSSSAWSGFSGVDTQFRVYSPASSVTEYASPTLTDGAATTNRLTAGSGSFVAGKVSETGTVTDLGWTANNYTEVLYSVTLVAANLANGDALTFRVLRNGATTGMTYTVTPTVNVTVGAAGPTNYNETGRNVTAAATVTTTDQTDFEDHPLDVTAAAAVTTVDVRRFHDPGLAIDVTATVTSVDTPHRHFNETLRAVDAAATVTTTDLRKFHDTLTETATATLTSVDTLTAAVHYDDTLRAVTAAAVVTTIDQADFHTDGAGIAVNAVRFDASADKYSRSASGLGAADLTITLWAKIAVDRNAFGTFAGTDNGGARYHDIGVNATGTQSGTFTDGGDMFGATMPNMTVGSWYFFAWAFSAAGTDTLYSATAGATTVTVATIPPGNTANDADTFTIGNNGFSDWINGSIAQVKVWTRALTQAQIEAEMNVDTVVGAANLWAYYSFRAGPQTSDESGNGRTLTAAGTLTTDTGPFTGGGVPLPVNVAATVTSTTPLRIHEPTTHNVAATVTSSDLLHLHELTLTTTFAIVVTNLDRVAGHEPTTLTAAATTSSVDQTDFHNPLTLTATATVTTTDKVAWHETLRAVDATATTTSVDQADFEDHPLTVTVAAFPIVLDTLTHAGHFDELNRMVVVAATVTKPTDQADFEDHPVTVDATADVTASDVAHRRDLALAVPIAATVTVTDIVGGHASETGRPVDITATVTLTTHTAFRQTLTVTATATVTSVDQYARHDQAAITANAAVTGADRADYANLLAVAIAATIAITDAAGYREPTTLDATSTVTVTDLANILSGIIVLNTALALYLGTTPAQYAYAGPEQVWP